MKFSCSGVFQDYRNWVILGAKLFVAGAVVFIAIAVGLTANSKEFYPIHMDESIYYNSARSYCETGSLKSDCCIAEQRSTIGDYNWYGPFYHLIYGGIAKVFGFGNCYFLVFNLFAFLLIVASLFLFPIDSYQRSLLLIAYLSSYASFGYIFTYYPEILHLLFSFILLGVYVSANKNHKLILVFVFLVIVFSLVRYSTVFWILGLLFIGKGTFSLIARCLTIVVVISLTILYFKWFTATPFVPTLNKFHLELNFAAILVLIQSIWENLRQNLVVMLTYGSGGVTYLLIALVVALLSLLEIVKFQKYRYLSGLYIICLSTFVVFFCFYTTTPFFFEKQTLFMVPVLLFIVVVIGKYTKIFIALSLLVFFPHILMTARKNYADRKFSYSINQEHRQFIKSIGSAFVGVDNNLPEINVLYCKNEFDCPTALTSCALPMSKGSVPICYTTNLVRLDASSQLKFVRHGRMKINYVLSRHPLHLANSTCVKSNKFYFLYEIFNKHRSQPPHMFQAD